MEKLQMKMVSSMEKCFYSDAVDSKPEKNSFVMFRNERLSFQVVYRNEHFSPNMMRCCPIKLGGALAPYAKVRMVGNVQNMYPVSNTDPGGAFITTEPGPYPDVIRPLLYPGTVYLPLNQTHAIWVDIELPEGFLAGEYDICVAIWDEEGCLGQVNGTVRVVAAELPKQQTIHTEWFHTDSIANVFHCKAFSEKHWKHIESYLCTAVKNGINMILTPVFTPELDTAIGGERLTTQLVDITLTAEGTYLFGFEKLHRWIDLCLKHGVEYFEIPHFFTQWGANAAPKIIVKVNGRKRKYFGWHTDSLGPEYRAFLNQFIPALVGEFKKRGLDQKCFYHVSDEPHVPQLERYRRCKELIAPHLKGYPIIDALSDFEFYRTGALEKPVPSTNTAMQFVEANIPGLWVYYCGTGHGGVSGRTMAMPLWRARILGVQMYYYKIEGFLHWGYNFYNTWQSVDQLNPFASSDGGYFTPAGDEFLVYPGTDGEAWESLRLNAMREAMDDIRALQLYEAHFGREAAEKLVMEHTGGVLTFKEYPQGQDYLLQLREKIASAFL